MHILLVVHYDTFADVTGARVETLTTHEYRMLFRITPRRKFSLGRER